MLSASAGFIAKWMRRTSVQALGGSAVVVLAVTVSAAIYYRLQSPVLITTYGDSTQEVQGNPHAAQQRFLIIQNRGLSGTSTADLLVGWEQEMRKSSSKIVVINHGINDRPGTVDSYRSNLRKLVTAAQKAGKTVVLEEPNPVDEVETPLMEKIEFDVPAFEARRQAMRDLATNMDVYFCAQPRVPLADGVHPSKEGSAIKAKRLSRCLREVAVWPWRWAPH